MNRKEVLKIIDIAAYVALLCASVAVVIFELSGSTQFLKISVFLYATSFLIFTAFNVLKLIYAVKKTEFEGKFLVDTKEIKLWKLITKVAIGVICFAFAVVVLAMY